jgi:hypothetical protein
LFLFSSVGNGVEEVVRCGCCLGCRIIFVLFDEEKEIGREIIGPLHDADEKKESRTGGEETGNGNFSSGLPPFAVAKTVEPCSKDDPEEGGEA